MPLWAPTSIKRIWILTFEYPAIARVGGLGEAVRSIAEGLVSRGFEVTIVAPSHGRVPAHFNQLSIPCFGDRRGLNGVSYPYSLKFHTGIVEGVRVVLVSGADSQTSSVIDVEPVYRNVEEKACMLARGALCLAYSEGFPDLIHTHDWHSAVAGVALKVAAEERGLAVPLVYHIHLRGSPSYPWHYPSEAWCGVKNTYHRVWRLIKHSLETAEALWDSCRGNVECFAVLEADAVAAVSKSVIEELLRDYGRWLEGKTCLCYNSTSWSEDRVKSLLERRFGTSERGKVRWRLVEEILRNTEHWGHIEPGGILVVSNGRMTWQKGFDVLLNATKMLPHEFKILVLGIRVGDYWYEKELEQLAEGLRGRAAVTYSTVDRDLYAAIHYSAHVFAMPSRFEPFGISAIEALAVGTPVVTSDVGGLREVVIDLRHSPMGVGLRVPPGDPIRLAEALESLGYLMYIPEAGADYIKRIRDPTLRELTEREPRFGDYLRQTAKIYVDTLFRPKNTVNSVVACYEKARQMAYYRAVTP